MSNGVSFSLVAGACCVVKFSNNTLGNVQESPITLNISSTGAKYIGGYTTYMNPGGITGYVSNSVYSKIWYPGYKVVSPALVAYDGSTYIFVSDVYPFHYSDYNDA